MDYMRHHAVLVTSWDADVLERAQAYAAGLVTEYELHPGIVSPVTPEATNGYRSFAIFPDGSKEGWGTSDQGNGFREMFLAYLDRQRHSDGSSALKWCLVQYGDDDDDNRLLRSEADNRPSEEAG